jgi:multidrug efflux pump subunit AcrA (membrane-fusion protein)
MKVYRMLGLVVLVSLLLTACGGTASSGAGATPSPLPPITSDAAVISQGRLFPKQYAEISFNYSGNVAEVIAHEGDVVQPNDVIARLVSSETEETNVAHAQKAADVARAQQEVVAATQELLDAQKAITDMTESTATVLSLAQAQFTIADLQKQIDDNQRSLSYMVSPDLTYYRDQVTKAQDTLTTTMQTTSMTDLQLAVTQAKQSVDMRAIELQDATSLAGWGGSKIPLQAKENYDTAVATLKNAQLRLDQGQITTGDAIKDAQKKLDDANKQLNYVLQGPDAIKVAQAKANIAQLQAQLAKAQTDAQKLKANHGVDPDKLKTAEDRVAAAQTRLATAQASLTAAQLKAESVELKAPFGGTVAVQNLKVGQYINAGEAAVTLANLAQWEVKTDDLTEIEVVKVKVGETVNVKLDALPNVPLTGVVKAIRSQYEEKRGDITYTVTVALTSGDPQVRWGMTAEVTFAN